MISVTHYIGHITSAEEVRYSSVFVCLFVCPLAASECLCKKFSSSFHDPTL